MALNDCGVCNVLRLCAGVITKSEFYTVITRLICDIADGVQDIAEGIAALAPGGGSTQAVTLYAEVLFGALTNAFVAAITDAHDKRTIVIDNETNAGVYVSLNGVDITDYVSPSSATRIELGSIGRVHSGNIYLKYASAPSAGSVIVTAIY